MHGRSLVVWLGQNSDLGMWGKKLCYLRNGDVPVALVQGMSADMLELSAFPGYFFHSKGTEPALKVNHTHLSSTQCSRRIKSQEYRWCVVMWTFPWLCKEIRSCVPCVSVPATGLSPSQTTIIRKKTLLSNEKVNSDMCIRLLCAIYLYFL